MSSLLDLDRDRLFIITAPATYIEKKGGAVQVGLMREIYAQISEREESVTGLSYTVWAERGGYFQNVKKVLSFTPQQIEFWTKAGKVTVSGSDLTVKKYVEDDLLIGGAICAVSTENTEAKE